MRSFLFLNPERQFVKALNLIIKISGVKYFCKATLYLKQLLFDKINYFFWNFVASKGIVALYTFLDFADISNYLVFEVSAWKTGYTKSFELQIAQTPFWKALTRFYQEKEKLQIFNDMYSLNGLLNFPTILSFNVLWLMII